MEERWNPSKEFDNYEVSDEGRVRNKRTGRVLKTNQNNKGYETVSLSEGGKKYTKRVHKMVANSFMDIQDDRFEVTHKDRNRRNNRLDNLELKTRSEIIRNTYKNGREQKHKMRAVRCVETGEEWRSIKAASEATGLNKHSISKCVNNPAVKTRDGRHFEPID